MFTLMLLLFHLTSSISGSSGFGFSASAMMTELSINGERAMADLGLEFLEGYSDNEIVNNKSLNEFRSFLSRIPKGDPSIPLPFRITYPLDQYVAFRRLVRDWPQHLHQLSTSPLGLRFPAFWKFKQVYDAFETNENGTLYNPNVTEHDLNLMKVGVERIRYVHGKKLTDLTQHLKMSEIPQIPIPVVKMEKWNKTDKWRYEYHSLCNGSVDVPLKPWQRCIFKWKFVPYFRLKVELIWLKPWVAMYHDLFTETQADELIKLGMFRMQVSRVYQDGKDGRSIGKSKLNFRVSMTAWLGTTFPAVGKLYEDIAFWTGLNTTVSQTNSSAEPLQIVNYGLGGMFNAHHDYFDELNGTRVQIRPSFLQYSGKRMMTWMLYLSEPILGGATVFPHLRQRVAPRKGSALVWENLKADSSLEPLSLHGGCPVAIGQKWIGNVWIRDNGQVMTKRCPRFMPQNAH